VANQVASTQYNGFLMEALTHLRGKRRYRTFADIERIAGRLPICQVPFAAGLPRDRAAVLQRIISAQSSTPR